ncbi:hypothetical protein DCAR_0208160 [Daucus carota subsp. sativus]|uniref:Replication protein A 70 kDa DNA-binding subunit B/D first OB fold domain-containing protein n=1 Tax=Daucus carota subsp. sativus TaxID=79200 RepID=A0AAF0WFF5_DAUCS|nr:PREDICTED: uncharacterized protein LOC108208349 [Daucus carota subsp. sativus]WOG88925.1 hypothetical protein DCAR_0208160 [Daucus carota subsp. sativus]
MSFNKYESLSRLDDSREDWVIRVRAQTLWKSINKKTGEFKGYNLIAFDDSSERIHAYISAQLSAVVADVLKEGEIYIFQNFKVAHYNGDETNRAVRNVKHIYFSNETKIEKDTGLGLKIAPYSFDFYTLQCMDGLKNDNRFLTDVIGVIENIEDKVVYMKDGVEKSHVPLTITDGRTSINVTFFNEFGDKFLEEIDTIAERPLIVIITSAKASEYNKQLYLTHFPATRFYLNIDHPSVHKLRKRYGQPNFYTKKDISKDEEPEPVLPTMKISELKKLTEDYIEKRVICMLNVKKVDEKMNWYICYCTQCDIEVLTVDGVYKCTQCSRVMPYPDKRFQLYTLCSDETGIIPVIWPNEEIVRLIGKEIYEVELDIEESGEGDKFPQLLKFPLKKNYNFTIALTKENLKEGSKVYKALQIYEVMDVCATHSPKQQQNEIQAQTEVTNVLENHSKGGSPQTGNSTNKTRPRFMVEKESEKEVNEHPPKLKNIKQEKP